MSEPRMSVLSHLNRLCEGHEGDMIERIRCHPLDRDALREECRELGVRSRGLPVAMVPDSRIAGLISLAGVPVVGDETLVDGPVIDWREKPDLDSAIRLIQKHLSAHPTRDMEESQR
jgi:hypothetical protein